MAAGPLGLPEIAWIGVVGVVLFVVLGPKNLPKMGKMFGATMKEVKKGMNEFSDEMSAAGDAEDAAPEQIAVEQASVVTSELTVEELEALLEAKREQAEAQPVVDADRKVAKIIYEDEIDQ